MSDLREQCNLPPKGWICHRGSGHAGPCAANPLPDGITEGQYWYSRWWDAISADEQAIAGLTAENERYALALSDAKIFIGEQVEQGKRLERLYSRIKAALSTQNQSGSDLDGN